jgi:hypothetical protein
MLQLGHLDSVQLCGRRVDCQTLLFAYELEQRSLEGSLVESSKAKVANRRFPPPPGGDQSAVSSATPSQRENERTKFSMSPSSFWRASSCCRPYTFSANFRRNTLRSIRNCKIFHHSSVTKERKQPKKIVDLLCAIPRLQNYNTKNSLAYHVVPP